MKNYIIICVITTLISCKGNDIEERCPDYITGLNNQIHYNTGEVLKFIDSLGNIRYDTIIRVFKDKPTTWEKYQAASNNYNYNKRLCEGKSFIEYSNQFIIIAGQNLNLSKSSKVYGIQGAIREAAYGFWNEDKLCNNFESEEYEEIYNYKGSSINVKRYSYLVDTFKSRIWDLQTGSLNQDDYIYNHFIYTYEDTIKLLEYSTIDTLNNRVRWVLQE